MRNEAVSAVSETLRTQSYQQQAVLKNDVRIMETAERHNQEATKHRAKLDNLVNSYHQSRKRRPCPTCRTWTEQGEPECPNCGRLFDEAEKLGLI
jgi:hypothetical protein